MSNRDPWVDPAARKNTSNSSKEETRERLILDIDVDVDVVLIWCVLMSFTYRGGGAFMKVPVHGRMDRNGNGKKIPGVLRWIYAI